MPWYLMLPVNISRNCDLMLAAIVTSIDALLLYYVTLDNRRKDARRCQQLNVIVFTALRIICT